MPLFPLPGKSHLLEAGVKGDTVLGKKENRITELLVFEDQTYKNKCNGCF